MFSCNDVFASCRWKGYRSAYDTDTHDDVDPSKLPLDDVSVVPGCNWKDLLALSTSFEPLRRKVQRILDGNDAEIGLGVFVQSSFQPTARKWPPGRSRTLDGCTPSARPVLQCVHQWIFRSGKKPNASPCDIQRWRPISTLQSTSAGQPS